ncbi:metal transporter CNNM3 isoform X2 [Phycodurus eques]|uniref:metal transporter CNNM3 isoform X2 n=1 Tax=Phycodurus eques TaxID=693459 RepID=UPI002ACD7046|nr:metal transporter CNNM3 isoform X2 [Phycodurus eques]
MPRPGARPSNSNMVASLAGLRLLLMILLSRGIRLGLSGQAAPPVVRLRPEDPAGRVWMKAGIIWAPRGASFKLRLFGTDLRNRTWPWLAFAAEASGAAAAGDPCEDRDGRQQAAFQANEPFAEEQEEDCSGLLTVELRPGGLRQNPHRVCVKSGGKWTSAGEDRLRVSADEPLPAEHIPAWGLAVLVPLLVLACGLLRTVHLSLLWLDPVELYVLHSCGSEEEKRAAKRLEPVRRRGNFLACSLLFLCVLGHSALGVLLFRVLGSVASAAFAAAFALFFLAELLPHAVCSVHGFRLAPGLAWLARLSMVLTCPLSCPLGLVLDLALRRDISTCCIRERAMEMIRTSVNDPYSEFVKEEFSRGTLRSKTVEDILTPLKDCFMLPSSTVLDFSTMSDIMQSGYTRVPIYEEERSNIVEILYVKDLALVDPDDRTPMTTITKFYNHPLHFVFNDTKLDAMLEEFKKGNSHMAIVQKVNNEGEGDPFYEVLGLVTLEDVIEEIIKSEILDESDGYLDRKVKRPLPPPEIPPEPRGTPDEFSLFKTPEGEPKIRTSPQLLLATHRFLSREVEHFSPARVSEKILFHLLRHPSVNQEVHFDPGNRLSPAHYLYTRNHPVDYFILLLQGRVEVEIGKEGLKFDNGAFTYYGVSALTLPSSAHQSPASSQRQSPRDPFDASEAASPSSYCPDYTVRALTDLQLIRVRACARAHVTLRVRGTTRVCREAIFVCEAPTVCVSARVAPFPFTQRTRVRVCVQVTRLQYLNALTASRGGGGGGGPSPEPPEIKILPNSHTKLLNDRNVASAAQDLSFSFFDTIDNYC